MIPRFRLVSTLLGLAWLTGCGGSSAPLAFVANDHLADELQPPVKPSLRAKVAQYVSQAFGTSPESPRVPSLAVELVPSLAKVDPQVEGGYRLYRRHCQHCHGSSGDGNGPTADFLFPRPRDYRKGKFKFTSTASDQKPTREDLRKVLREGLHGTSMPAFVALMSPEETERVIDYLILLTLRGEYETRMLTEAGADDEEALAEASEGHLEAVVSSWKDADGAIVEPASPRVEADHASIVRGRDLFWKSDCLGCHGPQAKGNGQSFVDESTFRRIAFQDSKALARLDDAEVLGLLLAQQEQVKVGGEPSPLPEEIRSVAGPNAPPYLKVDSILTRLQDEKKVRKDGSRWRVLVSPSLVARQRKDREAWLGSLDEWGNPLRPANLNRGGTTVYKGGRRPLDLYWRIAKGINGAKMPAHEQSLKPEEIWDLVNFVLALPFEPELLKGNPPPPTASASTAPSEMTR